MNTSAWRRGIGCMLGLGLGLATWPAAAAQEQTKRNVEERKFTFEVRDKPWSAVFEWLADQSGLSFIASSHPPGTWTFVPAIPGKTYTLDEIIDIMNEGLLSRKYVLIRRPTAILLAGGDERLDAALVPRVSLAELAKRGKTEIVSILLPLRKLDAKEFAPEVKKLLSPFGEIVVLAKANQLIVQETAGNLRQIIEIVQAVEAPEAAPAQPRPQAKSEQPPMLRTYTVPGGNATAIVKLLQDAHKDSTRFRITALGPNSIMVYASPDDQMEIARHLVDGARVSTELIPLTVLDPSRVAETLRQMFGEPRMGGPYVEAETDRNALIVRGTANQMQDIKEVLIALGEGGGQKGSMRILNLQRGSAATLAEAMQKVLAETRPNLSVKVIVPLEQVGGITRTAVPDKKEGKADGGQSTLTITATGNRLIVASQDAQALALTAELFRLMTSAGPTDELEAIRLKHAKAADVARVLDEAFNGTGKGGGIGKPRGERVRVLSDAGTNSLLIKANPLDTLTIRNLVSRVLDIEAAGDGTRERMLPKRFPQK